MRIGIIFGGQSREREISFAGGRTVYDNLNKSIFTPVPIFVDSLGNFIQLDWKYLYKGTIRDFYPAASQCPDSPHFFQIYAESLAHDHEAIDASIAEIGCKIQPDELSSLIDFAFLTLHGPYGEDGNIQGILEWYGIPFSGAGLLPSCIGIDKTVQKQIIHAAGFETVKSLNISREDWKNNPNQVITTLKAEFDFPVVNKAPHQGSSIGVSIVKSEENLAQGINQSFFIQTIDPAEWQSWSDEEKRNYLIKFTDIREGLGFPVMADDQLITHPEDFWLMMDAATAPVEISSLDGEATLLVESFIQGREFSCIVIEDENGNSLALPPTEIVKKQDFFDYRSKYLPGISRKVTPIDLPESEIKNITTAAERLFTSLHSQVYARIDGFYTEDGKIWLNDPNTTSGMLPSSFFFHQAAEIGLNPSQFITYIISRSIEARKQTGKQYFKLTKLSEKLNKSLAAAKKDSGQKQKVAVIMGGFSSERHISVESGRNIFEKLASSAKYEAIPVFLTGNEDNHELYQLPINVMLKDNADDIKEKVESWENQTKHPVIESIQQTAKPITDQFTTGSNLTLEKWDYTQLAEKVNFAFIALHGRPGEDGAVQAFLEKYGVPYNGSGIESSQISINKYETNEILAKEGILVADHCMVYRDEFEASKENFADRIEQQFSYPLIAKPADDGCSSAVKKIKNRAELIAFAEMIFRPQVDFIQSSANVLNLKPSEEFPQKEGFLIEALISPNGADKFLEITGGMLTHMNEEAEISFEVFEPSEALASGEVLSLEEKFLAGEGQNITPPRFATATASYEVIAEQVKETLEKTARAINVEGYCRIDAFVRIFGEKAETIIIEINSLPGMTPATAIFHQCALNGMKPYDFIDKIIEYGIKKQKRDSVLAN